MCILFGRAAAASVLVAVAGCAAVPIESGRARMVDLVQSRSGVAVPVAKENSDQVVQQWLHDPLQPSTAVQIALLRNPTLELQLSRLGIAAADVFEASRLNNPGLSLAVLLPEGGYAGNKIDAGATLGFSDLLLRHARTGVAQSEYRRTQELAAASIFDLSVDVQRAWFDYVAATQRATVRRTIYESAQSSADLAARYFKAGNIDQLTLQVQAAAASEADIGEHRAVAESTEARGRLQILMGLGVADAQWSVLDSLPEPEADEPEISKLRAQALTQRLDLAAARSQVAAAEQGLAAARRYRFLGPTELGVAGERDTDGSKRIGPSASLSLPVFKQGQGAIARGQAELGGAQATQRLLEAQISNDVQLQAARMQAARELVKSYREGLIPQREAVVARLQEQVNFMLTDVFNLLQAKQQEYAAYLGYIDAVHAYWSARIELTRAVGARLPADAPPATKIPRVQP